MSNNGKRTSLPEGWALESLSDLGTWIGGGTPSKRKPEYWKNGTIPWVSPKDMKSSVLEGTMDKITPTAIKESAAKEFEANSIAVVVRSGILEHTLPIALVPFSGAANQDMRVLTPRSDLDPRWVLHALTAHAGIIRQTCSKQGTTVASIEVSTLMDFVIPVPPPNKQTVIADKIEVTLGQLSGGKRHLCEAIRMSGVLREHLVDLATRQDGMSRSLGDCLREPFINGRSVPTAQEGFPVLRLTALKQGSIDLDEAKMGAWTADEARRFLVRGGDFLVARGNGSLRLVGRGGLVPNKPRSVAFPDTLIRVRVDPSLLRKEYLQLVWDSRLVRHQIERQARTTAGIYKINQRDLAAIEIPVPSLAEQDALVEEIRPQLRTLRLIEQDLQALRSAESTLRRSVLQQAFTGRLRA